MHPTTTPAHPPAAAMEVDSKPVLQHSVLIKDDDDASNPPQSSVVVKSESMPTPQGATAAMGIVLAPKPGVLGVADTTPEHAASGVKRTASQTDLAPGQPLKVPKLESQSQTAHTAGQTGPQPSTADKGGVAGQMAHTVRQSVANKPTAGLEEIAVCERRVSPDATPAENFAFSVHVDLKPVKLEWNPQPMTVPNSSVRHNDSSARVDGDPGRRDGAVVLEWSPVPVTEPTAATGDTATAAVSAPASEAHSAVQAAPQRQGLDSVPIKVEPDQATAAFETQLPSSSSSTALKTTDQHSTREVKPTQIRSELDNQLGPHQFPAGKSSTEKEGNVAVQHVEEQPQAVTFYPQVKAETTHRTVCQQANAMRRVQVEFEQAGNQSNDVSDRAADGVKAEPPQRQSQGPSVQTHGQSQGCLVQPQASARHLLAPGIKVLQPGIAKGDDVALRQPKGEDAGSGNTASLGSSFANTDNSALLASRKQELLGASFRYIL